MRLKLLLLATAATIVGLTWLPGTAQTATEYRLVTGWPKLPADMYFGTKGQLRPSPDTTRTATPRPAAAPTTPTAEPANRDIYEGSGVSGLAIDAQDHIYAFNRGHKPVLVFDTDGNLIMAGGDQPVNGVRIQPPHSGGVDWEGNVYVIDINNARVVKF